METKGSGVRAPQVLDGVIATLPHLRVIHRRCTDRWRRRRYVCQQRDAKFCSVPKTQNYREPEGNRTGPRRGRICRSLSEPQRHLLR